MNKKSVAKKANNSKSQEKKLGLDKFGDFISVPIADRRKVRAIGRGLQDYWLDCWEADPFGTHWVLLDDDPKNTTLAKYRKQLTELGLFMYEKRGNKGRYRIWCVNLRGARAHLAKKTMEKYVKNNGWESIPDSAKPWIKSLLGNKNKLGEQTQKLNSQTQKLDAIEQKKPESYTQQEKKSLLRSPQDSSKISSKEIFRARVVDLWVDDRDRDTAFEGRVTSASSQSEKGTAQDKYPALQQESETELNSCHEFSETDNTSRAVVQKSLNEYIEQTRKNRPYMTEEVIHVFAQKLAIEAQRNTEEYQNTSKEAFARGRAFLEQVQKKAKDERDRRLRGDSR